VDFTVIAAWILNFELTPIICMKATFGVRYVLFGEYVSSVLYYTVMCHHVVDYIVCIFLTFLY